MGVSVQVSKSVVLSSSSRHRKALRRQFRQSPKKVLKVANAVRDLGAQLRLDGGRGIGLLTKRVKRATVVARRLTSIGAPIVPVIRAIKGKVLPMALYACSTATLAKRPAAELSSAMANAILNSRD
eukprot:14149752-Alexandrium_andersonii.AAC.1